ncbi:MAG: hypothetical protein LC667_07635 [Thioalkalivibrio sp.]|nr:hypothetical protein [Thioalkalivibrio sp.]
MRVTYPIRVPRQREKSAAFREDAERIEAYVNKEIEKRGPGEHMIAYDSVAYAVGVDYFRVLSALGPLGGGHTAIMVVMREVSAGD